MELTYGFAKWRKYMLEMLFFLGASLIMGTILILAVGQNPIEVYTDLFEQAFFTPNGLMIAIQRSAPYIFTSAAAVVAFQGGAINMGLDGQFMVGGAAAAIAGYAFADLPAYIHIPLIMVICMICGAAAAFVPAIFKRMSGISEVVTGMIANLMMPFLVSAVISLTPGLRGFQSGASSHGIAPSAQLPQFSELTNGALGAGTKANVGFFVAVAFVVIFAIWIKHSKIGYEIRMTKFSYSFAEFAGIRAGRSFFISMMLSGAIGALGGAMEILGVWRNYSMGTLANVGNKGLILALAGGQNFFGSLVASFIYGGLESGAMNVSWGTTIPRPLIDIIVEIIVIFAAVPSMRMLFKGTSFADVETLGGRITGRN